MDFFLKLHLVTIIPALLLGPVVLFRKRGDKTHKRLGRIWIGLMLVSSFSSFGVTNNGRFSWLHGLAIFTIYQMIRGLKAIRLKNLRVHKRAMIGSFIGSVIAGIFAVVMPGRVLHNWIAGFFS